jgi:hypothetical protein
MPFCAACPIATKKLRKRRGPYDSRRRLAHKRPTSKRSALADRRVRQLRVVDTILDDSHMNFTAL